MLNPNIMLVSIDRTRRIVAFMDKETMKIGFLRNQSDLTVAVPPTYDSALNTDYLLYPVKKDGKWGVMDLGCRFWHKGYTFRDPIIPCEYNNVEVINDFVVVCDGKKIDIRKLGYEQR